MKTMRVLDSVCTASCAIVLLALFSCRDVEVGLVLEDTFDAPALNRDKWGVSFWPLNDGIDPEIVSSPTRAGAGAVDQADHVRHRLSARQIYVVRPRAAVMLIVPAWGVVSAPPR